MNNFVIDVVGYVASYERNKTVQAIISSMNKTQGSDAMRLSWIKELELTSILPI